MANSGLHPPGTCGCALCHSWRRVGVVLSRIPPTSRLGEAVLRRVREFYTELLDLEDGVGVEPLAGGNPPETPVVAGSDQQEKGKEKIGEEETPEVNTAGGIAGEKDKEEAKKGDPAPEKERKEKKRRRTRKKRKERTPRRRVITPELREERHRQARQRSEES